MKRFRTAAVVLALILGFGLGGAWAYSEHRMRVGLETYLENERQRSFAEMMVHVENVGTLLGKGLVSNSPRQNVALYAEIWGHANEAQANFSRLPVGQLPAERTAQFLVQVGDFANTLMRQSQRGVVLTGEQWNQLQRLQGQTNGLVQQLRTIRAQLNGRDVRLTPRGSWTTAVLRRPEASMLSAGVADGIVRANKELQGFPTLIYDGPFSSHIEKLPPKGLRPGRVSQEEARRIALGYVPVAAGTPYQAVVTGTKDGPIPAYAVTVSPIGGQGDTYSLDISQQGGQVILMIDPRRTGPDRLSLEQARQRAAEFLRRRGYPEMVSTYVYAAGGSAVVTFAALQGGVILYPDQVKVKVARDRGDVTGVEATALLMSNRPRTFPAPKLTAAQARGLISPRVQAQSERLALIPLDTRAEVLTYEFKVRLGGNTYLVYLNAETGEEERILQLIESPNGALTM